MPPTISSFRFTSRISLAVVLAGATLATVTASASHGPQLAFHGAADGDAEIYVMDAAGTNVVQLTDNADSDLEPAWSPDGTQIAFASNRDGDYEIFVMDADGTDVRQLTFTDHTGVDRRPAWSPDGQEIIFDRPLEWWTGRHIDLFAVSVDTGAVRRLTTGYSSGSGGGYGDWSPVEQIAAMRHTDRSDWEIITVDPDSLATTQLTDNGVDDLEPDWFPGGATMAFTSMRTGNREIFTMDADGSGVVQLTNDAGLDGAPAVSCDGSTIAFMSNRTGVSEIWTMTADGSQPTRLTTQGGGAPAWRCPTHPPLAVDDTASTPQYTAVTIAVLANDRDPDGDQLAIVSVGEPGHGTTTTDGSTATFSPDHTFKGTDSFTYTVADPSGQEATATVVVTEEGCGEHGLGALHGTPGEGGVSGTIDATIEPAAGEHDPEAAETLHGLNCSVVVPVEQSAEAAAA